MTEQHTAQEQAAAGDAEQVIAQNREARPGIDIDKLEALARAATPGERDVVKAPHRKVMTDGENRPWIVQSEDGQIIIAQGERASADAKLSAAADPATILALVDRLRALEADKEFLRRPRGELVIKRDDLIARLRKAEAREQALAAHVERLNDIHKHPFWGTADHWNQEEKAFNESPITSLARLIVEKQAEGMEILVPKVADGIGRSLSLSEDDIITLEEWIGDFAETHRQAKQADTAGEASE